ncbi:MAG: WbqC family protein [Bacteroidia bacterium]
MILGAMQPYFLPYLGYFRLIDCCDVFVILDRVNFINRGYIHKNTVVDNTGNILEIKLNCTNKSQNTLICDVNLDPDKKWKKKLIKSIKMSCGRAPNLSEHLSEIEEALYEFESISLFNVFLIKYVCNLLNINTSIYLESELYEDSVEGKETRIISLAKEFGCNSYLNPIAGLALYEKSYFEKSEIELLGYRYREIDNAGLSVLTLLMNNFKYEKWKLYGNEEIIRGF